MQKNSKIYSMCIIALFAAIICILSPFSIPIGIVPITFSNLIILLSIYILGYKKAAVSCIIYILMGLIGLPVFSNFSAGFGVILGPSGGFIIGFIPMVIIAGLIIEKTNKKIFHLIGMVLGIISCYLIGTSWFCVVMDTNFFAALLICVVPFLLVDILKIVLVLVIGDILKKRLKRC